MKIVFALTKCVRRAEYESVPSLITLVILSTCAPVAPLSAIVYNLYFNQNRIADLTAYFGCSINSGFFTKSTFHLSIWLNTCWLDLDN